MAEVRPMAAADLDAVRQVDADAFGDWLRSTGAGAGLALRTPENAQALLERNPGGCFVAVEEGKVAGYIFARAWGRVKWFGPFGVLPSCKGRGIGQALLAACVESLRREPGSMVGLETMPDSGYNLGLYIQRGFEPRFLTLLMSRELEPEPVEIATDTAITSIAVWSAASEEQHVRWLGDLCAASRLLHPGLDYTTEIQIFVKYNFGETLILLDGEQAIGFCQVQLVSPREDGVPTMSSIPYAALHPDFTDEASFRTMVDAAENMARAQGRHSIGLSVNTGHAWAVDRLLNWGYRIDKTMVRMVLSGTAPPPANTRFAHLGRWAG